jgi:hypothetical protein
VPLEQLGLATSVILTAFAITFGALMPGLAIAFGLGGQAAAKILLEEQFRARKKRDTDAAPHLWLDGHNCQPPTPNSQTLCRVGVGSGNWALGVDTRSLIGL